MIDPELFKEFTIKAVSTFVSTTEKAKPCLPNSSCLPRAYNKLSGNVTAKYAAEQLAKAGGHND